MGGVAAWRSGTVRVDVSRHQKRKGQGRSYDVHVEWDTSITRRKVACETIISRTRPMASPKRNMDAAQTAAALNARLRQNAMQAVTPMAKSAISTSNWNALVYQYERLPLQEKTHGRCPPRVPQTLMGSNGVDARSSPQEKRGLV